MAECSLKRYRYVGKERDNESGFYYIGARYYCPWLARWLAPDPINDEWYNMCKGTPTRNAERQFVELTASSYEYCYANPVRFTDPTGEQVPDAQTITLPQELLQNLPKGGELPSPQLGREILKNTATKAIESESGIGFGVLSKAVGLTIGLILTPTSMGKGDVFYQPDGSPTYPKPLLKFELKPTGSPLVGNNTEQSPYFSTNPDAELKPNPFQPKFEPKELEGDTPIFRSMKQLEGNWIKSPLEGAPNSSQLGTRTPSSVTPESSVDIKPVGNMVGPIYTGLQGLSGSVNMPIGDKRPTGMIKANELPQGLKAVQDNSSGHVSIIPSASMDFKVYQTLLNSINWMRTK